MEQNRELFRALRLEQIVTFIVIGLIVCVAALNILIALTMMVMEKTRDIAVLMSFGVRAEQVRRIFLLQGLLISAIGTALGLVIGYAASWAGGHYRFIHLPGDIYSIDYLPFAPRITDALIVAAVALGVSLVATPARVRKVESLASAVHNVLERIEVLTAEGPRHAFVLATNVYHKTAQGWRMVAHHASPGSVQDPGDTGDAQQTIH